MSSCCSKTSGNTTFPRKHVCPSNGMEYGLVSQTTIKHHIKSPWSWEPKDQGYYFCSDPSCSVVYFSQDNAVIGKDLVRTEIAVKENRDAALICYCFGVTQSEAQNNPGARAFVVEETKRKVCACETRNPSGKCCLINFPKK